MGPSFLCEQTGRKYRIAKTTGAPCKLCRRANQQRRDYCHLHGSLLLSKSVDNLVSETEIALPVHVSPLITQERATRSTNTHGTSTLIEKKPNVFVTTPGTRWQGVQNSTFTEDSRGAQSHWHAKWMAATGSSAARCAVLNCLSPSGVGAHIFIQETAGDETHYIMNACNAHNNVKWSTGWHRMTSGAMIWSVHCECRHRKPAMIL